MEFVTETAEVQLAVAKEKLDMDEQSDDITFTPEQVEVVVFDIIESVLKDKVS